jgi:hypothetical protein
LSTPTAGTKLFLSGDSHVEPGCQLEIDFYDEGYQIGEADIEAAISNCQSVCQSLNPTGSCHAQIDLPDPAPWAVHIGSITPGIQQKKNKRDDTWQQTALIQDAQPASYRVIAGNGLPSGGVWTQSNTETTETTVETSADVSAEWEIFSASAGISVSNTDSYSATLSNEETNNCNGEGILYFQPLFTQYTGSFVPDGPQNVNIFVPELNGDNTAKGNYLIECQA